MSMPEQYTLIWEQNPVMYDSLISDLAFSNASKIFCSSRFKMSRGLGLGSKGMGKVKGREDVGDGGGLGKVGGTGKSLGVVEEKKKVGAGGGNGRPASPGEGKRKYNIGHVADLSNRIKRFLVSVVAVDEHEDTSSPTYLTNSYNSLESWVAQDVSSILQDFEPDAQDGGKSCEVQNMGMQYGVDGNMVRTSLPSIAPENVGCSSFEPPIFPGFNGDFETLSPISQVWPLQSYEGVPSAIIPGIGEHQMGSFGMNRDYGDNDIYSIASDHNNPAALVSTEKGMHDVRNYTYEIILYLLSLLLLVCLDCRLYHRSRMVCRSCHQSVKQLTFPSTKLL
ncbi:hypothetical protein TB2_017760 [Malus domestica]